MPSEGRIELSLRWQGGRVEDVMVRNQRALEVWRSLVGRRVEEALKLAPLLSSICSMAQGLAAVRACEAALGVSIAPEQETARGLVSVVERLQNHLWFWLLTAPPLVRDAPMHADHRVARVQLAEVLTAAGVARGVASIGGVAVSPDLPRIKTSLEAFDGWLSAQGFEAEVTDLARISGPAGRLVRFVMNGPLASAGTTTVTPLPAPPAVAAAVWEQPSFARTPTVDGQPRDVGLLASWSTHPLVSTAVETWGPGVLARLAARYVETCALVVELREIAQKLRRAERPVIDTSRSGRGFGAAATTRGPLLHAVDLQEGRVVAWNVVAPTEWTFHPSGAVREALMHLTAPDVHTAEQAARAVVTVLDPCVEFTLESEL
jgi:uptake hydrogenase large subunit